MIIARNVLKLLQELAHNVMTITILMEHVNYVKIMVAQATDLQIVLIVQLVSHQLVLNVLYVKLIIF